MCDSLTDFKWLYRGVPVESAELDDVKFYNEVTPPRPDRTGEEWRLFHSAGATDTGYTSWTTDRSIAEAAADACSQDEGMIGNYVIFRVRIAGLDPDRIFEGRADEEEYLIEGTVENVEFSESEDDEDD